MVNRRQIRDLTQQIVLKFHPDRVILFGSYAYGKPTSDSDVDLLVILPFNENPARKSVEILNSVRPTFEVDLLARTPQQFTSRLALNDFFMREIDEKGIVLHESTHS